MNDGSFAIELTHPLRLICLAVIPVLLYYFWRSLVDFPRWQRAVHRFDSELELSSHQAEYEQRLVNEGFTFEGFRRDRRRGQPSMVRSRSTVARMLSAIPIRIPRRSPAPGRGRTSTLALIHS